MSLFVFLSIIMGQRLSPGLPLSFVKLWSDLDQLLAGCLVILYILLPDTYGKRVMFFCSAGAGVLLFGQFDGRKITACPQGWPWNVHLDTH
jgi:hypothetical protein